MQNPAYNSDPRTLVVVAHPDLSGASRVHKRWTAELAKHPDEFVVHNLYAVIPQEQHGLVTLNETTVEAERALLAKHERIVYQFPVYWYSCPALLRTWMDSVYGFGWAYGGEQAQPGEPGRMLAGKRFACAVSAGDIEANYCAEGTVGFTIDEVITPFRACANYVGATCEPHAFAVYGTENGNLSDERLEAVTADYLAWLRAL